MLPRGSHSWKHTGHKERPVGEHASLDGGLDRIVGASMPASSHPVAATAARLLLRRVTVLVVLLLVVYSGVKALAEYFGGDDDVVASTFAPDGDPSSSETSGGTAPDTIGSTIDPLTAPADDGSVPATDPPTSATPFTGAPSPDNKATVYLVGDSDAGAIGPYLTQLVDGTQVAETVVNYKVSSGLARPDFYNWPEALADALPAVDPQIIVATFGGNDSQGLSAFQEELDFVIGDPLDNEAEWSAEYTKRAGDVMDQLLAGGRTVIWVGIPNDDNPEVTRKLAIQDKAAKAAAAARPDVIFIDTWNRFSGRDGNWAEFVIDPRDGEGKDVRADDGFHLNTNGAEILALDIAQAVRDDLRARGANI
jgi:hypothetical protein